MPQFRWLLAGNAAFFLAMQGQVLTRTFLAWDLTEQEMSLAYINLAFAIPMLCFSLIGGAVSDRIERRRLVMLGQSLLIINEAAILLLLLIEQLEFWHLLLAGFLSGSIIPFIMPARTAIVFNVVGAERLGNAMALNGSVMNLARVLGPAMMGFAIDLYTSAGAYTIATVLFSLSFLSMLRINKQPVELREPKPLLADMASGLRYVGNHRPLLICMVFGMVPMFVAMPFQNLLVIFADDVWMVGERGLGIMMAAAGLGGVIGSIWIARRGESTHRIRLTIVTTMLFGAFLAAFSLSPQFPLALLMLVIANACASASQTLNGTITQLLVEDAYRGRISAIMMMVFGLTPLGVLPLAFLAQQIGPRWSIFIACTLLMIAVALFYWLSPTLKRLDTTVRAKMASAKVH